jgi:hypothetical protein
MLENLPEFIMVPQSASFVARLGELTVPRDCLRKETIRKFDDAMRAVAVCAWTRRNGTLEGMIERYVSTVVHGGTASVL